MTKEELKQEAENYFEDETEGTFQICEDCYWFADAVQTAYVDSAEPREKRIAELEAKIKHLTKHLEPQAMSALFEQIEEEVKQKQRIEELEKENAELKEKLNFSTQYYQGEKAKELLKKFIDMYYVSNLTSKCGVLEAIREAEQFLKESEVEK